MGPTVARVYLLDVPYYVDKPYDYFIPEEIRPFLNVGGFCIVPFGGGNKKQLAIISELVCVSDIERLKPVLASAYEKLTLTEELKNLCFFIKEQTFCTLGDAVRTVIPAAAFSKLKEYYSIVPERVKDFDGKLSEKHLAVLAYLRRKKSVLSSKLFSELGEAVKSQLTDLVKMGLIISETEFKDSGNEKYDEYATLAEQSEDRDVEIGKIKGKKQKELIELLLSNERLSLKTLKEEYGIQKSNIKPLVDKDIVFVEKEAVFRDPYGNRQVAASSYDELSPEQENAVNELAELCHSGEPRAALLFGVTGSGKTRVIKEIIDETVKDGRSAIVLVPEISLTPQTVERFRSYYRDRMVVVHSGLSAGERYDAWRRMRNNEIDVCVGTRSAVFAPFENLGLIVIDEEQEHTYKSDMSPKYHARDIARYRCAKNNALMLLSSATPSHESYRKALDGTYKLVTLKKRYGNAKLPQAIIADMRPEAHSGSLSPIGGELKLRIGETLAKGEQTILFVNRRGYNNFLSCPLCGEVLMCPHCSVSYTYHTVGNSGYLICHYCGAREHVPERCPSCGNESLRHIGYGTQKVEEEIRNLFPKARILRMDADTTSRRFAFDDILDSFRKGEADILIGTQMVTKGHDFPNVTLVGVLNADNTLHFNDYRAAERTFALVTQVIGRSGRADKDGVALVQTFTPDHPVIQLASKQDYEGFFENDCNWRKSLVFPPYCDVLLITLSSNIEVELQNAAVSFSEEVGRLLKEEYSDIQTVVFGPIEAPIYKINETFRLRFVLKLKNNARTRQFVKQLLFWYGRKLSKKIGINVDMNPNDL